MSTSYEYSSTSSSKGGAEGSGLFEQIDSNNDGVIDRSELASFIGDSSSGVGGSYESSSYKKSSKVSSSGGVADIGLVGLGGRAVYESSSYSSGGGRKGNGRYQALSYESTGGYDASEISQAASYTAESNAAWTRYGAEVRGVGLYYDPNPKIIRRKLPGGVQTYTQNVRLRFLQPPPLPPPGPLIVKEVRPPAPPPLPPLIIKQHEGVVAQLPPLILREKPPTPPASAASETVIRHLPALPVPPRSVIIERYAGATVAPRDIIIERWLPYSASSTERKTIVQRSDEVTTYEAPQNVIIQYDVGQVRVVRQFQQLGVTQENPQAYIAQYGAQLLDAQTLLQQARAAGVVEDISVPTGFSSLASYSSEIGYGGVSDATFVGGARIVSLADRDLSGVSSTYSSKTYESSSGAGTGGVIGAGYRTSFVEGDGLVEGGGSGYSSSTYKSSSYSSSGGAGYDVGSTGFSSTEAKL